MHPRFLTAGLSCILCLPLPALAQHAGHSGHQGAATLSEPGQGAFAALSEVVTVLEADPETDWAKVDLDGLRAHLIDMDRLVTDATVTVIAVPGGLRADATGEGAVLDTVRRMVPAHAAQLRADTRWTVTAEEEGTSVVLTVTSDDPAVTARIRGLGFYGLMASQDHHRVHHMAIARGVPPQGH
ncbi:MAG: hypothetical protein WBA67_09425 [Jannaschia sp.]